MNLFFINIHTQFCNSGDALINRELIKELRKYGKLFANCDEEMSEEFIEDLQIKPEEMVKVKSTFSFSMKILKAALKAVFSKDTVYSFGGLGDCSGGNLKNIMKDFASFAVFCLYRLFGVKIVSIGKSFGRLTKAKKFSQKIRSIPINYYFVRDMESISYCNSFGIKKAKYCPDLSWLLSSKQNMVNDNDCVAITFRTSVTDNKSEYENNIVNNTVCVLREIQNKLKKRIKVVVFYQVEFDAHFMENIYKHLSALNEFDVQFISNRIRLNDVEKLYARFHFHISNRMHSIFLGFKYGSLPIALIDESNKKIISTFKDASFTDLIIKIGSEENQIIKRVTEILENQESYLRRLITYENECQEKIENTLKKII